MTALRRTLGLVFVSACIVPPTFALSQGDIAETFNQGVEALRRGEDDQALAAFQKVLAQDPSHEAAYDLWRSTEHQVWLDMLVKGGEFELVAKRLSALARAGREERRDEADAIRGLVDAALSDDVVARRKAVLQLSADHGEFAVPHLLPYLADTANDDRRVLAMHSLTRMSTVVVPPLLEALSADDAFLRRNVALTLGHIGDPRAAGLLTWHAANDSDDAVKQASREAASACGAKSDALTQFLSDGDDYHHRRHNVLSDIDYSPVVWSWQDGKLVSKPVPRFLYNDAMAEKAYYRALAASPASREALAGIARSRADVVGKLDRYAAAGADIGAWSQAAEESGATIGAAGTEAVDLALAWSARDSDAMCGTHLCQALASSAATMTPGLTSALSSHDGAIRSEAANAAGEIARRTGRAADPAVVSALAEAAAREIVRVAIVVDADAGRGQSVASALEEQGLAVDVWNAGTQALAMLRRAPGADVILVAETLPDLTAAQVVSEIRADERFAETPVFLLAADAEAASATWEDRIAGALSDAGGIQEVLGALEKDVGGDRARAEELAQRAAGTLAGLAEAGDSDLTPALRPLASTLARSDAVAIPAMRALGAAGTLAQVPDLVAVVGAEDRAEAARVAAADALTGIFGRNPANLGVEGLALLEGVALSSAPSSVRTAAARALGAARLDPKARAELLERLRGERGGAEDAGESGGDGAEPSE